MASEQVRTDASSRTRRRTCLHWSKAAQDLEEDAELIQGPFPPLEGPGQEGEHVFTEVHGLYPLY